MTAGYWFILTCAGILVAAAIDNWIHQQVVSALIAAAIVAVAGVLFRSPADRESARQVTELQQQVARQDRELKDPNRPVREMGELAKRSRAGDPFTDRNRPPGW